MKSLTQLQRTLFVSVVFAFFGMLGLVGASIDLREVAAQQPQATPRIAASGYQYFFPFIGKACQEYCAC